jgi:hypothetical protein
MRLARSSQRVLNDRDLFGLPGIRLGSKGDFTRTTDRADIASSGCALRGVFTAKPPPWQGFIGSATVVTTSNLFAGFAQERSSFLIAGHFLLCCQAFGQAAISRSHLSDG